MIIFLHYFIVAHMKNIWNNWLTDKAKTIEFYFVVPFTNKNIVAKWSNIFKIYKLEESNIKIHSWFRYTFPEQFWKTEGSSCC